MLTHVLVVVQVGWGNGEGHIVCTATAVCKSCDESEQHSLDNSSGFDFSLRPSRPLSILKQLLYRTARSSANCQRMKAETVCGNFASSTASWSSAPNLIEGSKV